MIASMSFDDMKGSLSHAVAMAKKLPSKADIARGRRIEQAMLARGMTQETLASALSSASVRLLSEKKSITRGAVGNWILGKGITTENLRLLVSVLDVPLQWVLAGQPPEPDFVGEGSEAGELKRVPLGEEFAPDPVESPRAISSDHRVGIPADEIPQAETFGLGLREPGDHIQIDIGGGGSVIGVAVSDTWRVPGSVLRRRVSTPIQHLHFLECEGNSMKPLINDGDVVLVDRSKRNPRMPGIFALWEGDGQTIKEIEIVQGAVPPKLRLIPANKDYTTYEVLADDVIIIGRYVARFTVD